jgi:hypothetical protein
LRKSNGATAPTIAAALASLVHADETVRIDLPGMWVDVFVLTAESQTLRRRLIPILRRREADEQDIGPFLQATLFGLDAVDDTGKISELACHVCHAVFVAGWGGYDANGKECELTGDDGEAVECTAKNFTETVRGIQGGADLYSLIVKRASSAMAVKTAAAAEEKKASAASLEPPPSARSRSTRNGLAPEPESTRSGRRSAKRQGSAKT